ncbi:MAG TPA: class I SAM-dependent methyltransferase [Polyangia bacterium]|nr:class I SAM-dependent methyltransferase [Polyangia bacterium]
MREPWPSARTRQRRREFASAFSGVPARGLGDGLEIGGGDGFLASLLVPLCRSFVTTDSFRPRLVDGDQRKVRRLVCDGTAVPFKDQSFDFIFSSSVLEHVRDRAAVYQEMRRCLRPGGLMLHIMPSRTWKLLQLIFYYPHLLIGGGDLLLDRLSRLSVSASGAGAAALPALAAPTAAPPAALSFDRWSDQRRWRVSLRTVLQGMVPRVHGEYPDHVREWVGFGAEAWKSEFQAAGLHVCRIARLPLYSGYGFGLERLRHFGERMGLSAHNAFLISTEAQAPASAAWFDSPPLPQLKAAPPA